MLITASKSDDLKALFPQYSKQIDQFIASDPTPSKKYLEWSIKQLKQGFNVQQIIDLFLDFHKYQNKLQNKDINSYSFDSLKDTIYSLQQTKQPLSIKEIKQSGSDKIYESPNFVVIHPKSKNATCFYGSNTKWCITQKDEQHFENYSLNGIVFYIIINKKSNRKEDPLSKIAYAISVDNKVVEICFRSFNNRRESKRIYRK